MSYNDDATKNASCSRQRIAHARTHAYTHVRTGAPTDASGSSKSGREGERNTEEKRGICDDASITGCRMLRDDAGESNAMGTLERLCDNGGDKYAVFVESYWRQSGGRMDGGHGREGRMVRRSLCGGGAGMKAGRRMRAAEGGGL